MRILAVLAGRDVPVSVLSRWLDEAECVYAADGAADLCFAAGRSPDVVVGDLDSISDFAREGAVDLRFRPEQDMTDADKLLVEIQADGESTATVCGLEGDLPDHEMAALSSCVRASERGLKVELRYRRGRAWIVSLTHPFSHSAPLGTRISVLPLIPGEGLSVRGVEWPLERTPIVAAGRASISNRALGGQIEVTVESGAVWVFVGNDQASA